MEYPEDAPGREVSKSKLPLAEQDKIISDLTDMVGLLAERLQPVLTPTEPSEKEIAADRAVPVQSEHATTLTDNNSRIRRVRNKVNNLIERLEV